jgi:hypothetical protein
VKETNPGLQHFDGVSLKPPIKETHLWKINTADDNSDDFCQAGRGGGTTTYTLEGRVDICC